MMIPTLFLFFYAIATKELFAPKARRGCFVQNLNSEIAKNSLCKIAFSFTKHSIFRLSGNSSKTNLLMYYLNYCLKQ